MPAASCRCLPTHRGAPVDVSALNRAAAEATPSPTTPFPFLVVPGYTPRLGWRGGLHPRNVARLARALADLEAGVASMAIVSGGAVHSADNEAVLMREWLLARGVPERAILVEPCARHSTTNLRNAGRLLLERGAAEALVVTSDGAFTEQSFYLGFPWISGFHLRCLLELGHLVGELEWMEPMHVRFRPAQSVWRQAWWPTRRDP